MKILAIDTSTPSGSIAILEEGNILAEHDMPPQRTHAEKLLPAVDSLFKSSGVFLRDIDLFAAAIGPGSFTGLRIGIAAIKGFAWVFKKPVTGVSTLKALAMNITDADKLICPILDARKNEVYAGIYKWEGETISAKREDFVLKPEELVSDLKTQTIFLGEGIRACGDIIKDGLGDNAIFTPHNLWHIKASNIAKLALLEAAAGNIKSPESIMPHYIRRSDAEVKTQFVLT